jgi:hypothetical protein
MLASIRRRLRCQAPLDGVAVPLGEKSTPRKVSTLRLSAAAIPSRRTPLTSRSLMHVRHLSLIVAIALSPLALGAQHGFGAASSIETRAPREASQYDFLVGEWTLAITPKVSGLVARIHGVPRLHGSWKGSRALDGWGEEDELRIVDESGNPIAYTHFVRIYDPAARHWSVSAIDVYRQRVTTSIAQWQGNEMVTIADGIDPEGKPYRSRTHVTDISATGFRYTQDISHDGGATWDEGHLVMQAKRVTGTASR